MARADRTRAQIEWYGPQFTGSAAGRFLLAALVFVALKLTAAVVQVVLHRGDYRHTPDTAFSRAVYVTGKATPALAAGCASVAAFLQHHFAEGWSLGAVAHFVSFLAI
ncbi:MAG TPA: hypothetical protein VNW54_13550 [Granulicella sp.]|jgi:hypothetical protein|nr:hypothetical protein [Granulicella sp.]